MNPIAVSVWNGILGAFINGILMMFVENTVIPTTSQCICYLLLHILGLALGGTLAVVGYQVVAPFVGTLILSLEVVLLVVAQYTILSHVNPGHRNVWEIFGVLVILLANIMRPIKSLANEYRNRKDNRYCLWINRKEFNQRWIDPMEFSFNMTLEQKIHSKFRLVPSRTLNLCYLILCGIHLSITQLNS
jgi:hypothetical protein